MQRFIRLFRRYNLHFWAVMIAIALWLQVHGQGEGSLSMDVPLQVQGLPADTADYQGFAESTEGAAATGSDGAAGCVRSDNAGCG